ASRTAPSTMEAPIGSRTSPSNAAQDPPRLILKDGVRRKIIQRVRRGFPNCCPELSRPFVWPAARVRCIHDGDTGRFFLPRCKTSVRVTYVALRYLPVSGAGLSSHMIAP